MWVVSLGMWLWLAAVILIYWMVLANELSSLGWIGRLSGASWESRLTDTLCQLDRG